MNNHRKSDSKERRELGDGEEREKKQEEYLDSGAGKKSETNHSRPKPPLKMSTVTTQSIVGLEWS